MKKILVFSPVYNEKNNVLIFINKFISKYKNFDLLIIDDNSPDNTGAIIKLNSLDKKNIKLIQRKQKLGLHTAYKMAFNYAAKNKYDHLISIDFDLQHDLNDIKKIQELLKVYNFVIGSRYMIGGKCELKGFRFLLSYWGNLLIKYSLGMPLNEFTTALRGYDKKTIQFLTRTNLTNTGYSFQLEVVYKIFLSNFKMKETPINFKNRLLGKSKIPYIEPIRYILYLTTCLGKKIFGHSKIH